MRINLYLCTELYSFVQFLYKYLSVFTYMCLFDCRKFYYSCHRHSIRRILTARQWQSSVVGINPTSLPLDVVRLDVRMLRIIEVEQTVLAAD